MIKSAVFSVSGPGAVIENGREHDFDDIEDDIALHVENMERLGKSHPCPGLCGHSPSRTGGIGKRRAERRGPGEGRGPCPRPGSRSGPGAATADMTS